MEDDSGEDQVRRAWLRWLGVGTGSLALIMIGVWTQRGPIAEGFVSRELNRRGVQATYDLVDVGFRTQRIENLVLGNPARPDLVARWVEVDIAFAGLSPQVAAVRAGGVRIRGAYRGGVLDLGEIDKFRDANSTGPFALPDIRLGLDDARLSLATDFGPIGMQIDGKGNLRSGFDGRIAAAMPHVAAAGCRLTDGGADMKIVTQRGRILLSGPVRAGALACASADTALARPVVDVDVTLGEGLGDWSGWAKLSGDALRSNGVVLASPAGRVTFDGTAKGSRGQVKLGAKAIGGAGVQAGGSDLSGGWSVSPGHATFDGVLTAQNLRTLRRDPLAGVAASAAGTPVGPLLVRIARAVRDAGNANSVRTRIAFAQKGQGGSILLSDTRLNARSGARAGLSPDGRFTIVWPGRDGRPVDWRLEGALTTGGGGLPDGALRLARRPGGGFGGQLFVDPYAVGDARLALDRVRFVAQRDGTTRISTALRLDGPLPDGHVRGVSLPLEAVLARGGRISINQRCVPVSIAEARYASFSVGRTHQTLCPVGGALVAWGPRGLTGGADIQKLDIVGRSGDSPLRLTADHARVVLDTTTFALANPSMTIGPEDAPVRLAAATLDGTMGRQGMGGRLTGAGGQIGSVPLIVEDGAGDWRFDKGALSLKAAMTVRDSQSPVRFHPLSVPDFALMLKNSHIVATGTLAAPASKATVAKADIAHDLGSGKGHADLDVPGIRFGARLQPSALTPLTVGVVENLKALVTGKGRIDWTGSNVTSTGTFRTDNADFAAAFGPVQGLSGEIRFTDLIGLVTAKGQEVRIRSVNPGVEALNGVVRYHLEPGQKVRIEGGRFPFSGGELVLLPTTMNFGEDVDRYLTFRVIGLDAGSFIQAMDLKNVSATGVFDGIMPLIFNAQGGRVAGGVLVARQDGMPPLIMPEGVLPTIPCDSTRQGGTLSYVGPVSNEDVGVMGKVAFDALKNLQYKCLTILMDGALDGEMVTNVVFNGVNRDRLGSAPAGIARSFVGLPFIFNVRIAAPFRGLLGTAQSLIDPTDIVQEEVGKQTQEKMRAQGTTGLAVQPLESDKMRHKEPE